MVLTGKIPNAPPKSSSKKNMSRKSSNNEDTGRHGADNKSSGKKKTSELLSLPKEDGIIHKKKKPKTAKSSSGQKGYKMSDDDSASYIIKLLDKQDEEKLQKRKDLFKEMIFDLAASVHKEESKKQSNKKPNIDLSSEKKIPSNTFRPQPDEDHSEGMNSNLPPSMRGLQNKLSFPSFQEEDKTDFQQKTRKSRNYPETTFRNKSSKNNYFSKASSSYKQYPRNEDSYNLASVSRNIPPSFQGKKPNYSTNSPPFSSTTSSSSSSFITYGRSLFSTREFHSREPRIFFNKYLRKKYIIMNIVGSNSSASIKHNDRTWWNNWYEHFVSHLDTYFLTHRESLNKDSINRVDIYGLFKAIDFPVDYYKRVEKSNLSRLISACQDYLRNIIDGIPVKKIPRNLYLKHTHNLWSCKEFKSDVRIVFNEDEQRKRMRFILVDHSIFVQNLPSYHRDAWLNHVPGLIDFCHKIKERNDLKLYPDYNQLNEALIDYGFNFESYKSFAEKDFDIVEHIQDFVYCLHTGIEESKVFNYLPHLAKKELPDDFIVNYNCPFEYKRVDNNVVPFNPPNDDGSSGNEENYVSSKPEEVSNNETFEIASLHRVTLKENFPTLYNKYKIFPNF